MSERMIFVSRLLAGERMAELCREFSVSRKTGYKIFSRYKDSGLDGLKNISRAVRSHPNQTPRVIEKAIIELRNEHPTWGAPKIKAILERRYTKVAACSTIHAILIRHDLITKSRRRSVTYKSQGTDLSEVSAPNKLWCTDFKGQFKMGNDRYCYPLTITDQHSRYLIRCDAMESINQEECIEAFENVFEEYGLPDAIRSDNGVPFASKSYFGLSKLSIFWLRMGIGIERIKPGCPEQNGRHERMHRTLKAEATKPAGTNILQQQEKLDAFKEVFNNERPHQALNMKIPVEIYKKSERKYKPILESLEYPDFEYTYRVTKCGSITLFNGKRLFVGVPFGGENLGIKKVEDGVWKLNFMNYELGFFDATNPKLEIAVNPFLTKEG